MSKQIDLSKYNNSHYNTGASYLKRALWGIVSVLILKSHLLPFSFLKVAALRLFGSKIGKNVTIKPGVNIKFPWKLVIGNNCWIGENVWIDNLDEVKIEDNVCISQGAFLLCGTHNYKKENFDLIVGSITIETGAWICAKSIVCPGVKVGSHTILSLGSLANTDLEAYSLYNGNPAKKYKDRIIE